MSANNGDKARHNRAKKRKAVQRAAMRKMRAATASKPVPDTVA